MKDGCSIVKGLLGLMLLIGLVYPGKAQWKQLSTETNNTLWSIDFVDSTTGWVAGSYGKLLRTHKAGHTWQHQKTGDRWQLFDVQALNDSVAYSVSEYCRVYSTQDRGQSWNSQITRTTGWLTALEMWNADTGFVVGYEGLVQRTVDGMSWVDLSTPTTDRLYDITFINSDTGIIVGENGLILQSVDSGTTWSARSDTAPATLRGIALKPNGSLYAAGYKGVIVYSSDRGNTWNRVTTPTSQRLMDITFVTGQLGYAVGAEGIVLITEDGGQTWEPQNTPTSQLLTGVQFLTSRTGYVSGAQGTMLKTTDGGVSAISKGSSKIKSYVKPNPFHHSGKAVIKGLNTDELSKTISFKLIDKLGHTVVNKKVAPPKRGRVVIDINRSDLPHGLYVYRILTENGEILEQGKVVIH